MASLGTFSFHLWETKPGIVLRLFLVFLLVILGFFSHKIIVLKEREYFKLTGIVDVQNL